jgi:bacterioferritin-associated ferredoxin
MIVCLCEAMSERNVRQAVREGACSRFELSRSTGAGTHCGSCRCDLKHIVRDELQQMELESEGSGLPMAAK